MASKQLVLLRHAKSSWDDPEVDDHDRVLNSRGRHAANRIGRHLRDEHIRPDLVLCSSSARTRETLDRLELPAGTEASIEAELYAASASTILDRLRRVDGPFGCVLVIGHNPGIHDAALSLLARSDALPDRFPTAALVGMHLPIDAWNDLRPGTGRLDEFVTPRQLT